MERLTYRGYMSNKAYSDYERREIVERLAEYEELEVQGLLLKLPCKVGSTLYQPFHSDIIEYKVTGVLCFDIIRNEWMLEISYEVNDVWYKTICELESVGKIIFLTRGEAEQALEQMKAGGV